jgi:hypothetical protein
VSSFYERPEVKLPSAFPEIAINGCVAVVFDVSRKMVGELTVRFFSIEKLNALLIVLFTFWRSFQLVRYRFKINLRILKCNVFIFVKRCNK